MYTASTALTLTALTVISVQKALTLVRYGLPFVNPCLLFPITFWSFAYLEMAS